MWCDQMSRTTRPAKHAHEEVLFRSSARELVRDECSCRCVSTSIAKRMTAGAKGKAVT